MTWTAHHLWLYIATFDLNCYHQWSLLVVQNRNRDVSFLHIREGEMQGYLLAMVAYGIFILPLIKKLKLGFLDATEPWQTHDAGAIGLFHNFLSYNFIRRTIRPRRRG